MPTPTLCQAPRPRAPGDRPQLGGCPHSCPCSSMSTGLSAGPNPEANRDSESRPIATAREVGKKVLVMGRRGLTQGGCLEEAAYTGHLTEQGWQVRDPEAGGLRSIRGGSRCGGRCHSDPGAGRISSRGHWGESSHTARPGKGHPEPHTPAGNPEAGTESYTSREFLHEKNPDHAAGATGCGFRQEPSGFPTLRLLSQEHRGGPESQSLPASQARSQAPRPPGPRQASHHARLDPS